MPRKSTAALSVLRVDGKPRRVTAPKGLQGDAAQVFMDIVSSCPPEHFTAADRPLLAQFCEALALSARAARELHRSGPVKNGRASAWLTVAEKAWRATAALAPKLRLCPSARYDARAAGRKAHEPPASIVDRFLEQHERPD